MIVGARLARAAVSRTTNLVGVSKNTNKRVKTAYRNLGVLVILCPIPVYENKKKSMSYLLLETATAGSDVVQSGRPIFDGFLPHLWPYISNNTVNVVFQMVKRLWLIRIDQ
ncbi:hypothetical protein TNCV_354871 [Trichonephila clavipes]|uniref:Uncharacterized protein n=1 Tax=Trichonephila clavipes TaxID=2585209 RepID=A0A8X6W1L9_TRICX|nr:hypothetical protein TNCV_354871 [Trichonephila clavipes]